MDEHERNLHDLYAGLAMMGLVTKYGAFDDSLELAHQAQEIADALVRIRQERTRGQTQEETGAGAVSDMAVPDMEGREDRGAQGIASLKKTRTRSKPI